MQKKTELSSLAVNLYFQSIANNDIEKVEELTKKFPELKDTCIAVYGTPLMYAIRFGSIEMVAFLINEGADIRQQVKTESETSIRCQTPLTVAIETGCFDKVNLLILRNKAIIDAKFNVATSPISSTFSNSNEDFQAQNQLNPPNSKEHVKAVKDHNRLFFGTVESDKTGKNPIHLAVKKGSLEIVERLIEAEPRLLNLLDARGHTPLFWAALYGHVDIVEYLVNKGASLKHAVPHPSSRCYGTLTILPFVRALQYQRQDNKDLSARYKDIGDIFLRASAMAHDNENIDILINRLIGNIYQRVSFEDPAAQRLNKILDMLKNSMNPIALHDDSIRHDLVSLIVKVGAQPRSSYWFFKKDSLNEIMLKDINEWLQWHHQQKVHITPLSENAFLREMNSIEQRMSAFRSPSYESADLGL